MISTPSGSSFLQSYPHFSKYHTTLASKYLYTLSFTTLSSRPGPHIHFNNSSEHIIVPAHIDNRQPRSNRLSFSARYEHYRPPEPADARPTPSSQHHHRSEHRLQRGRIYSRTILFQQHSKDERKIHERCPQIPEWSCQGRGSLPAVLYRRAVHPQAAREAQYQSSTRPDLRHASIDSVLKRKEGLLEEAKWL